MRSEGRSGHISISKWRFVRFPMTWFNQRSTGLPVGRISERAVLYSLSGSLSEGRDIAFGPCADILCIECAMRSFQTSLYSPSLLVQILCVSNAPCARSKSVGNRNHQRARTRSKPTLVRGGPPHRTLCPINTLL